MSNKLAEESLEGLLKCEASLIGEIRGLDGERKALVYDNYSKLIGATETIGKVCFKHFRWVLRMGFIPRERSAGSYVTRLGAKVSRYGMVY